MSDNSVKFGIDFDTKAAAAAADELRKKLLALACAEQYKTTTYTEVMGRETHRSLSKAVVSPSVPPRGFFVPG